MKFHGTLAVAAGSIFLLLGACSVAPTPANPAGDPRASTRDFGVYSEYSDSDKPMRPEANTRLFNRVEAQSGDSIRLDKSTGVVTLKPGTYHITTTSIVTFYDPTTDTDGRVTNIERSWGGYSRLRYRDKPAREDTPIAVGTISSANMLPSTIDTYLRVDKEAEIMLDHQAGAHVEGLYLQVAVGGSALHVFARISVLRL
jgi:hypothetical protein